MVGLSSYRAILKTKNDRIYKDFNIHAGNIMVDRMVYSLVADENGINYKIHTSHT